MSILVSKLVSVFIADTQDLKKGYDETKRGAKEVTRELKSTEDQANRTARSFLSMARQAAGFLAAAVAAGKSAQQIISEAANIVALDNFAYTIDESVESVDAFSKAIMSMGGSADDAQSTLSSLFSKVKEASEDSASSAALDFAKMGISLKDANGQTKDLMSVLYDLSGVVEGMDASKAREYIESVGITDRNVVEAMMRGRKELEGMIRTQKELGVVSKESAENARAFDAAVGKLSVELQRAKEAITDAVLPVFTWFVEKGEKAVKFINENKEVFKGFFFGIAAVVTAVMIPAMWRLAASVLGATWPFLLIAAIIGLVGAAIWALKEDFEAYKNGNKSMIGELIKDFEGMGKRLSDIFEGIKDDFTQMFIDMWNAIQPYVYKIEQALSAITMGNYQPKFGPETQIEQGVRFAGVESEVPNMFGENNGPAEYWVYEDGKMVGKITPEQYKRGEYLHLLENKKNIDQIQAERGIKEPETVYEAVVAEGDVGVGIPERGGMPSLEETINKATSVFEQLTTNPLNKMTSQQIGASNSNTEINIGDISIQTQSTDAKGILDEFQEHLRDVLKGVEAESATGIAR